MMKSFQLAEVLQTDSILTFFAGGCQFVRERKIDVAVSLEIRADRIQLRESAKASKRVQTKGADRNTGSLSLTAKA